MWISDKFKSNVNLNLQNAPKMPRPLAPYRRYHGVSSCGASVGPATKPVIFWANDCLWDENQNEQRKKNDDDNTTTKKWRKSK